MNRRKAFLGLGILLLLFGIFMPPDWYDPLPPVEVLPPPPISGLLLLQLSLIVEGGVCAWFGIRQWKFTQVGPVQRLSLLPPSQESPAARRVYAWLVAGLTLLGLLLRLVSLNSDLWLDEIATVVNYRNASLWQIVTSFIATNNHLLNTLLVKICTVLFGEQEWAIRLPAAIFGAATIPILYWAARQAMPRRASLSATLLLAVSYHHIFFSQNARGYTAYVFFSLIASALLVKGLQEDRGRVWVLYIVVMVLNFASLLISAFVFAAHLMAGCLSLVLMKRRGQSPGPMFKRLLMIFAAAGFLGFQLYAAVLPQMYVYIQTIYADPAVGYTPFSVEFAAEIARGLSAGFGTGLLFGAIPFLAVAGAGYVSLVRRNWVLILALTAPGALHASLLVARNLVFSPRFFILALPLAILVAIQGIDNVSNYAARLLKREPAFSFWSSVGLALLASGISLVSLPGYYAMPKQAYRSSLAYLEATRKPEDIVIVIHLAEGGYRYYGEQSQIREGQDYFYVHSVAALDETLSRNAGKESWLVTTFPRALRISLADLDARIQRDWGIAQEFPGTVGDGDITVWRQRQP